MLNGNSERGEWKLTLHSQLLNSLSCCLTWRGGLISKITNKSFFSRYTQQFVQPEHFYYLQLDTNTFKLQIYLLGTYSQSQKSKVKSQK